MKIKNMSKNKQSQYQKLMQMNKRNLKADVLVSVIALLLAFAASKIPNAFLLALVSIISLILSGAETVSKLIRGTKDAKLDTVMVVAAIIIPFCLGEFVLAAYAMGIYKLSTAIISSLLAGLGKDFRKIVEVFPRNANVIDENSNIKTVPSDEITKGTKFMVKTGEIVPVDCVIDEGFSEFDASAVHKSEKEESLSAGDKVPAGYVNTGSSVVCTASCDFEDSIVKDLNRLADMADTTATLGEKRFVKLSKLYPVLILLLAIVVLLIYGMSTGAWGDGMKVVSSLLIAATTGSVMVAVPLFSSCTIWKLKRDGIAISTAEILDEVADINCVAFEKNGILTDGKFEITDKYATENFTEDDLLMIAGICVGGKNHPISKIFTKYMNEHLVAENVMEFPGKGVECTIMGKTFLCGTEDFVKESGIDISEASGYRLYITIDNVLMGALSYEDALSEDAAYDVEELKNTGVEKTIMFTPDKGDAVKAQFKASGADEYIAELTPFGRAEAISKIKEEEGVTCAYVGEASGSEQAMDEADVGISLISKDANGLEHTKVTLFGKLRTVADAIEAARLSNNKLEIHFYCASAAKIITVLLGLFAVLNVAAALIIDAVLTMAALISAKELLKK